jgi:hypothetical protein
MNREDISETLPDLSDLPVAPQVLLSPLCSGHPSACGTSGALAYPAGTLTVVLNCESADTESLANRSRISQRREVRSRNGALFGFFSCFYCIQLLLKIKLVMEQPALGGCGKQLLRL